MMNLDIPFELENSMLKFRKFVDKNHGQICVSQVKIYKKTALKMKFIKE